MEMIRETKILLFLISVNNFLYFTLGNFYIVCLAIVQYNCIYKQTNKDNVILIFYRANTYIYCGPKNTIEYKVYLDQVWI